MPTSIQDSSAPVIISADDVGGLLPPVIPKQDDLPAYKPSCYSKGLTPELVIEGYRLGSFPWPDEDALSKGLYPWGRLFPCTLISTDELHLSHSLKKRIRDALAGHYKNRRLNIYMDIDFDGTIDAIADYHETQGGTWMSAEIVDTWKALHQKGCAHTVSVYVDDELMGGLYFTSVGRMLYGESMFSLDDDLSKIALVALAAFAKRTHHPLIDCQMPTAHVANLGAYRFDAESFLHANAILTATDAFQWEQAKVLDLLPFIRSVYSDLTPRPSKIPFDEDDAPQIRLATIGNMMLSVTAVKVPCSYHDTRISTMEIVPLPSTHPQLPSLYNLLVNAGFRRDSGYLYRLNCEGCQKCIPTRLDTWNFRPNESMRRAMKKNSDLIMREIPLKAITDEQYALYKRYQDRRHLDGVMGKMSKEEVNQVLFSSCAHTSLLEFRRPADCDEPNRLMMVCIIDKLQNGISAVYNFFEPDRPKHSLGTYGIVSEIEFARRIGVRYVYLGYWLPGYPGMDYKTHYRPLDIFWNETWIPHASFDTALVKEPAT